MKFNKSAESEKWYVEGDLGELLGVICTWVKGAYFEQGNDRYSSTKEMREITEFMENIERESGIDTTSTFTSNSQ